MQGNDSIVQTGLKGLHMVCWKDLGDLVEVMVESAQEAGVCPDCLEPALVPKERLEHLVQDAPVWGKRCYLRWRKRRWRCGSCGRSFSEHHEEIPPRARATQRFQRYLHRRVAGGAAVSRVAQEEGVSYYRVQRAFDQGARRALAERPEPAPTVLGIDEAAHRKGLDYNTVITDPQRRKVLEVVRGRDGSALGAYLRRLPAAARRGIRAVAIDMWVPYRRVVATELPQARIVVDKFHVIRTVGKALDRVRRRVQRQGRRRQVWNRVLFRARHALLKEPVQLTDHQRHTLRTALTLSAELATAYDLYQAFRQWYRLSDSYQVRTVLAAWYQAVATSGLVEFQELVDRALKLWEPEILAYFSTGLTNAFTEGVTNKVKVIKRTAYGYRNFDNFRQRVLALCG